MPLTASQVKARVDDVRNVRKKSITTACEKLTNAAGAARVPDFNAWAAQWHGSFASAYSDSFSPTMQAVAERLEHARATGLGMRQHVAGI